MKICIYNLDTEKLNYSRYNLNELLNLNEEVVLQVNANINTTNIIEKLTKLVNFAKNYSNVKIFLSLDTLKDYLYDNDEIKKLSEIATFCEGNNIKHSFKLKDAFGEFNNIIMAKKTIDDFAEKLNSLTINQNGINVPLSTLEKYFVVYKFVSNRVYDLSPKFLDGRMRNWVGVLTSEYAICTGFSSLLKCVCDRVFSKEELMCFKQGLEIASNGKNMGMHSNNLVVVNDKKYDINGLFTSDSCWGANNVYNNLEGDFTYCLNPITIYGKMPYQFIFSGECFFYNLVDGVKTNPKMLYGNDKNLVKYILNSFEKNSSYSRAQMQLNQEEKIKIEEENNKIKFEINSNLIKHLEKNKLIDICALNIPKNIPKNILKKYPKLKKYNDLISSFNFETSTSLSMTLKIKKLKNLYEKNIDFFNELYCGKDKLEIEYIRLKDYILDKLCDGKIKSTSINLKTFGYKTYQEQKAEILKHGKEYLLPPPIPLNAVKNGLRAVAKFLNITDEAKVEEYVNTELNKMKNINTTVLTGMPELEK